MAMDSEEEVLTGSIPLEVIQKDFILGTLMIQPNSFSTLVLIALLRMEKSFKLVARLLLSFHGSHKKIIEREGERQIDFNWFENLIFRYFDSCEMLSIRVQSRNEEVKCGNGRLGREPRMVGQGELASVTSLVREAMEGSQKKKEREGGTY